MVSRPPKNLDITAPSPGGSLDLTHKVGHRPRRINTRLRRADRSDRRSILALAARRA
jgi:hypothetical protein